jgi:hypothetical protein
MIRTYIKPNSTEYKVSLDIPEEYIGKELEVLVFQKHEGLAINKSTLKMKDFWNKISDETASKLHQHVDEIKKEWDRDI